MAFLTKSSFAQRWVSPISWHQTVYEARVASLGQSSAALNNGTSYHVNPAIPLESGVINVSSFLFSATAFKSSFVPRGANLYSPAISFSDGTLSYASIVDFTTFNVKDNSTPGGAEYSNRLIRMHAGYRINDNFSLGAGILHNSYNPHDYGGVPDGLTAWGITVGVHYQKHLVSDCLLLSPQLGFTLNDISNGFGDDFGHMPGQIRLGLGLDVTSKNVYLNRSVLGGGIYSGFSKYLTRLEYNEVLSQARMPNGFEAIFTTWNSYRIYTGNGSEEVSLSEQISTSFGLELHFLQTVFLRYGIIGGAELWVRPYNGIGAEVDLYYISLAITKLNYNPSEYHGHQENSTFVQATFRIPVDGKPRDTLIGRFINR